MIAFGSCIVDPGAYIAYALPGIQAAAEPAATVFAFEAVGNVSRSNNLLLDAAAALDDLEALVLVEEHVELPSPGCARSLRAALADPDVAVVGCMGATGVRTIAWWEGRISRGRCASAITTTAAASSTPWAGRRSSGRRGRSTRSTGASSRSRRGRCARCASTRS